MAPIDASLVTSPTTVSTYKFPASHERPSPEEVILRPILLPIEGDWVSIIIIMIYTAGAMTVVAAFCFWLKDHQHPFIKFLQHRDSHHEMKFSHRHKRYEMRGTSLGGILTVITRLLAIMGIVYVFIFYFKQDSHTLKDSYDVTAHCHDGGVISSVDEEQLEHVEDCHAEEEHEEDDFLKRKVGIPANTYREVRFVSYQEESLGSFLVQRMRHNVEFLFTLEFLGVNAMEGHVYSIVDVSMDGCDSQGQPCLQLRNISNVAVSFTLRRPYELSEHATIRFQFADDVLFTSLRLWIESYSNETQKYPHMYSYMKKTFSLLGDEHRIVAGVRWEFLNISIYILIFELGEHG